MPPPRDSEYIRDLVTELRRLPNETEWVEFKVNNRDPQSIGEYISALANGSALVGKPFAYQVWGIEDSTHDIVGTNFSPDMEKMGNEPLENWLLRSLRPSIDFRFHEITIYEKRVVLMEIESASYSPVAFNNNEFIRVGSVKKRLRDHPEKEKVLWQVFFQSSFEDGVAAERVSDEDVLLGIDYPAYFSLLEIPLPDGRAAILDALDREGLITSSEAGGWNITNMGAILFAKKLADFSHLGRKAMRVIQYKGTGRIKTLREQTILKGYATGFEEMVGYIMTLVPSNEVIEHSLRRTMPMFPEIAIRELVANALVHQDFRVSGAGPMVEIFDDRIEITNPGAPLVDTLRFVDTPPKSRNEALAALMRRFGFCEERGSGIDKVVFEVERNRLPAPVFEAPGEFTRATLFAYKDLSDMIRPERVLACYMHACLRYVSNQPMNNVSVRNRFGLRRENVAMASKLLREALDAEFIVIRDPQGGNRNRTYLPYWAAKTITA